MNVHQNERDNFLLTPLEAMTWLSGVLDTLVLQQSRRWVDAMHQGLGDAKVMVAEALRGKAMPQELDMTPSQWERMDVAAHQGASGWSRYAMEPQVIAESLITVDKNEIVLDGDKEARNKLFSTGGTKAEDYRNFLIRVMVKAIGLGRVGMVPAASYAGPDEVAGQPHKTPEETQRYLKEIRELLRKDSETNADRAKRYEANAARYVKPEELDPSKEPGDAFEDVELVQPLWEPDEEQLAKMAAAIVGRHKYSEWDKPYPDCFGRWASFPTDQLTTFLMQWMREALNPPLPQVKAEEPQLRKGKCLVCLNVDFGSIYGLAHAGDSKFICNACCTAISIK